MAEVVGKRSAVSTGKHRRETEPQVVFHVTGFGEFAGVSDNPTKHLIKNLPAALSARGIPCVGGTGVGGGERDATGTAQVSGVAAFAVQTATVLHVSAKEGGRRVHEIHRAIDEAVAMESGSGTHLGENHSVGSGQEALAQGGREAGVAGAGEPRVPDRRTHVLIHCGVDEKSTAFALETRGYNEATFRVPDEGGYRPTRRPVDESDPDTSRVLSTTLPIAQIMERLGARGWGGEQVRVSTSAGRFVCNFVLYTSLNLCEAASRTPPREVTGLGDEASPCVRLPAPRYCLFLHVPRFRAISQEKQMDFLVDCLTAIAEELRSEASVSTVTSGPGVSSGTDSVDARC